MDPCVFRALRAAARRLVVVAVVLAAVAPAPGETVQDLVDQVSVAGYRDFLDNRLYTHDGDDRGFTWVGIMDKYMPTADHNAARNNVLGHFQGLGLDSSLDAFTFGSYAGCNNVIGVLPGRISPESVYVIGGHYDSVDNPGADDNASGVAGVMEAARILSRYAFASTIMFVAWDGEEKGLKGSYHWVNTNDTSNIDGVANLDMIAYNHNGADVATIYGSTAWRTRWAEAFDDYCLDVTPIIYTSTVSASDHWPFQNAGRPAGGVIESTYTGGSLPNPHYHQQTDSVDTPNYIDYDYAADILRGAVGLIAEEARLLLPGDADDDGDVDWLDYAALKSHFGQAGTASWADCDFDGDGNVDYHDYRALSTYFGETLVIGAAAVPEPATLGLLAMGAVTMLAARRRRPARA